jgi:hypothetical protein
MKERKTESRCLRVNEGKKSGTLNIFLGIILIEIGDEDEDWRWTVCSDLPFPVHGLYLDQADATKTLQGPDSATHHPQQPDSGDS